MSSWIDHIVFDVGRVLIGYEPELAFLDVIEDALERRWFLDNVCNHDWNIEQDRGRDWREAEALAIAQWPDHEGAIRAFRANWHKMIPGAIDDSVVIMRQLISNGHDVTMLTNFAADTFEEAQRRFDFLNEARGVTVSAHLGLLKPDQAIYDSHVSSFGLEPAAILFIDDSAHNVEGAMAAGWQAIQFINAETLKGDLERFGIDL
ncbi:MAG: HAD family phosphatase [Rhizobiaceae bacterium]